MLTKLFKYECRATARVLLPVYGGAAALTLLTLLLLIAQNAFPVLETAVWFQWVCGISEVLTGFGLLALFLVCIFINIQRFYKLLGDQGYLMFTLPATTNQQMAARLFCSVGWTVVTTAVLAALALLLTLPGSRLVVDPGFVLTDDWPSLLLGVVYVCLLALLGIALGYLLLYLCMVIGAHWPQQRLFASVVTFFVIQFALQLLALLLVIAVGAWLFSGPGDRLIVVETLADGAALAHPPYWLLLLPPAVLLAADAAVWFPTHRLMDRHLNLA